jgi:hypothetical protein
MRHAWFVLLVLSIVAPVGCSGNAQEPEPATQDEAARGIPGPTSATPPATPPAPLRQPVDPAEVAAVAEYTRMFYEGRIEALHAKFSEEMQGVLSLEQLTAMYRNAVDNYGKETQVLAEDSDVKGDYRAFVRWARFDKTEEVIELQWILRPDDAIAGFYIRPAPKRVRGAGVTPLETP